MGRSRPRTVLLLAVVALCSGAWWFLRDSMPIGPRSQPSSTTPPARSADGAGAGGASTRHDETVPPATTPKPVSGNSGNRVDAVDVDAPILKTAPPEPLPTLDAPVAEIFDALNARAARGDVRASCRLAVDLTRCAQARAQATYAADYEKNVSRGRETPEEAVRWLARAEEQYRQAGKGCESLSGEQLDRAFDFQLQTALASPKARLWFALQPALDPWNFVNDLDRWQTYRNHAMPFLEEAAGEGDPAALIALARVHGDLRRNGTPPPRFRIPDQERFLVYAELMRRQGITFAVVAHEAQTIRSRLGVEALQRVDERVATLERRDRPKLDEKAVQRALSQSMQATPHPAECAFIR